MVITKMKNLATASQCHSTLAAFQADPSFGQPTLFVEAKNTKSLRLFGDKFKIGFSRNLFFGIEIS